jgi:hypothetical protein
MAENTATENTEGALVDIPKLEQVFLSIEKQLILQTGFLRSIQSLQSNQFKFTKDMAKKAESEKIRDIVAQEDGSNSSGSRLADTTPSVKGKEEDAAGGIMGLLANAIGSLSGITLGGILKKIVPALLAPIIGSYVKGAVEEGLKKAGADEQTAVVIGDAAKTGVEWGIWGALLFGKWGGLAGLLAGVGSHLGTIMDMNQDGIIDGTTIGIDTAFWNRWGAILVPAVGLVLTLIAQRLGVMLLAAAGAAVAGAFTGAKVPPIVPGTPGAPAPSAPGAPGTKPPVPTGTVPPITPSTTGPGAPGTKPPVPTGTAPLGSGAAPTPATTTSTNTGPKGKAPGGMPFRIDPPLDSYKIEAAKGGPTSTLQKMPSGFGTNSKGQRINLKTGKFVSIDDIMEALKAEGKAATLAKYAKFFKFAGPAMAIIPALIDPALAIYNGASDQEIRKQIAGALGTIGGAYLGAIAGTAGATMIPVVGQSGIGNILGGIVGGVGGALSGEYLAESIADALMGGPPAKPVASESDMMKDPAAFGIKSQADMNAVQSDPALKRTLIERGPMEPGDPRRDAGINITPASVTPASVSQGSGRATMLNDPRIAMVPPITPASSASDRVSAITGMASVTSTGTGAGVKVSNNMGGNVNTTNNVGGSSTTYNVFQASGAGALSNSLPVRMSA